MDQPTENLNNEEVAVLRHVLELLPTMEEGMKYCREKLKQGHPQACLGILGDLIEAFEGVEESLLPLLNKIQAPGYMKKHDRLKEVLSEMVEEYENRQGAEAYTLMEVELYPAFTAWREELEENLPPLTAS